MEPPTPAAGSSSQDRAGAEAGVPREAPASLLKAFAKIGPGLILAAAIVGTGELIATTNLGAKVGFALLWLVVVSCLIKVFVQIELGRYAISSGESSFQAFKRLPGPGVVLVWWCAGMLLVTQTQIGAMIGGISQALNMLAPLPEMRGGAWPREWPWAFGITAVTIVMLATGSYRLVERVSTLLVAGFTIMTVVCVMFLPAEHAVRLSDLAGGLNFAIPAAALLPAFTMFGITGVGATELIAYPYWCIEKGYARYVGPPEGSAAWAERARGWMRVLRLDAWFSMGVYTIATLAFFLLGAAVLHKTTGGKGLEGGESAMIRALVDMYAPVLGAANARVFVVLGAFCVLYSTLFAATAGNSRMLADFLCVNGLISAEKPAARRWAVRLLCVALPLAGLVLFLIYNDLVGLVTIGAVMQGLTLPLIGSAALYLRYRRIDRRIAPGLVWDLFLWVSVCGLTLAALFVICDKLGIRPASA